MPTRPLIISTCSVEMGCSIWCARFNANKCSPHPSLHLNPNPAATSGGSMRNSSVFVPFVFKKGTVRIAVEKMERDFWKFGVDFLKKVNAKFSFPTLGIFTLRAPPCLEHAHLPKSGYLHKSRYTHIEQSISKSYKIFFLSTYKYHGLDLWSLA